MQITLSSQQAAATLRALARAYERINDPSELSNIVAAAAAITNLSTKETAVILAKGGKL